MAKSRENKAVIVSRHFFLTQARMWVCLFGITGMMLLAGCAENPLESPQRVTTTDVFHDTRLLETQLKRGKSTGNDIKRILGEPTGSGAVLLSSVGSTQRELWFYQDMELTGIKSSEGQLEAQFRQQILVILVRDGLFDGYMWFSNSDSTTAWVKDTLRGKVVQ